ncbi:hypothetical protein AZO1586R_1913 [Bathymodiolus azoricus thioautotrophic gill symbiont]|uniref:Uncharacterized protein n=1 Tax=Bathymodiolus azoricus thioautotrophic gill symbiont TaxID=235205 RepID=A0ACA8ZS56_9GAMM|nr:hypothetical protein AZO1586R_1913 [Bathymodiolus azoricus thioautotrophic gill symbiont]CAC9981605.1 hypothetical protein [uncultured Gammaproteobacteria bacterium]
MWLSFCFHPMGETVFWLKLLYQLGLLCFFSFYFWIGGIAIFQG